VKTAAANGDFVPLYAETQGKTLHGWRLLDLELGVGDVLYLTIPANRLEQLWRIAPDSIHLSSQAAKAPTPPPSSQKPPEPPTDNSSTNQQNNGTMSSSRGR
jgi:hypothetical protein